MADYARTYSLSQAVNLIYIDPGAGSMVIQAVLATALAIPFFFRTRISRVVQRMRALRGDHDDSRSDRRLIRPAASPTSGVSLMRAGRLRGTRFSWRPRSWSPRGSTRRSAPTPRSDRSRRNPRRRAAHRRRGTRSPAAGKLGGIIASALIVILWSKELIDAAAGIIGRAGPIIGVIWLLLIGAAVGLGAYLVVRRGRRPSRERVTQLLNRTAALLLLATVVFGLISGKLPALVADLRQGISLQSWADQADDGGVATSPDLYAILL